jgi:hypothetical protein
MHMHMHMHCAGTSQREVSLASEYRNRCYHSHIYFEIFTRIHNAFHEVTLLGTTTNLGKSTGNLNILENDCHIF